MILISNYLFEMINCKQHYYSSNTTLHFPNAQSELEK